jgi:hypothetical protein
VRGEFFHGLRGLSKGFAPWLPARNYTAGRKLTHLRRLKSAPRLYRDGGHLVAEDLAQAENGLLLVTIK